LLELAPDAMLVVDQAGRVVLANIQTERLFGYRQEEILGCAIEILMPERFRKRHRGNRVRFSAEPRVRPMGAKLELFGLRKDGTEFPVEISLSLIQTTEGTLVTSAIRDTSERHCTEEALRESEKRFRLVADNAPVLIWMSGTERLCEYFNKSWLEFTGRSMEKELGNGWAEGVHPDDFERCFQTYSRSFDRRENFRMEYRLRRHDGEYRWVLDIGVPRFNEDGSFAGYIGSCVDVTDSKRSEQIHSRHTAIVQSSDDAIIAADLSGTITDWNQGAEQVFGYSAAEAIGQKIDFLSPADKQEESRRIVEKVMKGEAVKHFDTVRQKKDGTLIDVSLTVSPILSGTGQIMGLSGIAHDISLRRRFEEEMKRSEEKFSKVFRHSPTALTLTRSKDHSYVDINRAFEEITGWHRDELIGRTPFDIDLWLDPGERVWLVAELLAGKVLRNYEVRYRRRDGTEGVALASADLIQIGDESCVLSGIADITVRKMAERELLDLNRALTDQRALLQSREELLKIFVKNVPAGIAMFDRNMRYLQVSDRWCADYGVDNSQILGRSHYEVFPDIPDRWKEMNRRGLGGETLRADEDRWDRDGETKWLRWEIRPWWNLDSAPGGIFILAEDITPRKRMEEALSDATRKLLEAQEHERARIARELHDDINQRLAFLSIELGQIRVNRPELPTEILDNIQKLQRQTKQISADVQALSHDLHSPNLEFLGLAEGMKSWCEEFGERQGIKIEFKHYGSLDSLPPEISLCLFRVLQESLHNTVKHAGAKQVAVQLREESSEIELVIRDSGKGFDIDAAIRGRGLGLTSMQERVRLVGGMFVIYSQPSGGTSIQIRVPFQRIARLSGG
jgi:PAS domain S-box-containing protein